jgi:hypothetical protein
VTSLSENTTQLSGNVVQVIAEPAGIAYWTADAFATVSQVADLVSQLYLAFETFSSSLSSAT